MPAPYSSVAVANTFIEKFGSISGIEHMKLQKLVYCSYGWWLTYYGLDGIKLTEDGPEIWRHGPVFPELYQAFKVFGRKPITTIKSDGPFSAPRKVDESDDKANLLIGWVWGRYGHLSSFALSDMTHKPGTPWHRVASENKFRIAYNTKIPNDYIHEEFCKIANLLNTQNKVENAAQREEQRQTA